MTTCDPRVKNICCYLFINSNDKITTSWIISWFNKRINSNRLISQTKKYYWKQILRPMKVWNELLKYEIGIKDFCTLALETKHSTTAAVLSIRCFSCCTAAILSYERRTRTWTSGRMNAIEQTNERTNALDNKKTSGSENKGAADKIEWKKKIRRW